MAYGRSGFTPSRQPAIDWIRNEAASAGGNQVIAKGDAVASVNGVLVLCTAGQDPQQYGYGIVLACYTSANRPFTFYNTKIIASGQAGRVDVCFDPNQTYSVQCVTSVGLSNLGKNVMIDASAAGVNPLLGISGMSVDIPASASVNDLFKLINISPYDEVTGGGKIGKNRAGGGGPNNGVEVRWNRHFLQAPTANQ